MTHSDYSVVHNCNDVYHKHLSVLSGREKEGFVTDQVESKTIVSSVCDYWATTVIAI